MIRIKQTKVFTCDIEKPYHWTKLSKLVKIMNEEYFDFSGLNLKKVKLAGANFKEATLRGVNFKGANLVWVNLEKTSLQWARFKGSHIR